MRAPCYTHAMTELMDLLFSPLQLGKLSLSNRIVMAPMTRNKSPHGVPGDDVAAYYQRRAAGQVGLIITEGTVVDHAGANGYPAVPHFYGAEALAGWRKVVDAVHGAGGKLFPQLWHVGAVRRPGTEPDPAVGGFAPSGLGRPGGRVVCKVMTDSDIADVIDAFARSASAAKQIGCDGVELHGAHGYLLDQFFWDGLNQRNDEYGGSLEARARFGLEVVRAVRAAVGPEFPISLRWSQWKLQDYNAKLAHTMDELTRFLVPFVAAGVDIFHCSTRRYFTPELPGSELNLAGLTKQITGKPTITVGSVGLDSEFVSETSAGGFNDAGRAQIDELLRRLSHDEFDLVAIGRALIADADWPRKLREGRGEQIRPFAKSQLAELT